MFSIFNAISDFFSMIGSLIQFIFNMVTSLIDFVLSIPKFVTTLVTASSNLPSIVIPFFMASISITVVFLLIGRQNNT